MHSSIRIAIDGAQATGKTTLLGQIKGWYGDYFVYIPEASRIIAPQYGVKSATDWPRLLGDAARLSEFFAAERRWQSQQESRNSRFVVDSSLYLIRAYQECFDRVPLPRRSSQLRCRYDLILYCPLNSSMTEDGFRFGDRREDVDRTYSDIVSVLHGGLFQTLPYGDGRIQLATQAIDSLIRFASRS